MREGTLQKLSVQWGEPARYELLLSAPETIGSGSGTAAPGLDVNALLGRVLDIEYLEHIACCHCGRRTRKSFAQGYCYPCFRSLARCDLCVVSPDRCHYAAGTCREPEWGESFCMQPHLVYLANSTGPKVGITRRGAERGRWLDQGATQGLVIMEAPTRHLAGLAEVAVGRYLTDRTDWRALVRGDAEPVDLPLLRDRLRRLDADDPLVDDQVRWAPDYAPLALSYPILRYPSRIRRFRLERDRRVRATLVGVKGQFLLFDQGVLNVRQHTGFHVRLRWADGAETMSTDDQMELFSP